MPFIAIPGSYHCSNYSPDGDTVRFEPTVPEHLSLLTGVPAKVNRRGHASLRLEGIDALETHYNRRHQPLDLARAATEALLQQLGIVDVLWDENMDNVISANDATPGYILARSTDKFGRVIAFLIAGDCPFLPGTEVMVHSDTLAPSVNFSLLGAGLAYPTFYWGLFSELRDAMTQIAVEARARGVGLYASDTTNILFTVDSIGDLTDRLVILPKLFRRASDYIVNSGSIVGFKAALEANREPVFDLVDANFTHFDTFIIEDGNRIAMTRRPEELVFDPMPERPGSEFLMSLTG